MISDLAISTRAVDKNKNSITSVANPFMKRSENDLSPHAQPKGFRTSLPIPRLEAVLRLRGRSKGSRNNDSRPLFFDFSSTHGGQEQELETEKRGREYFSDRPATLTVEISPCRATRASLLETCLSGAKPSRGTAADF